jgi:1,5-anhydro-D-fructose reductase (1,5-anhydro-D-mannitol-forming)
MNRLGWGVIGIGDIVQSTIAPAMVTEPDMDLVAAVSRDQGRADEFAARFGARFAYTSYDQMLANPEVEAVFIATPNNQHAEQVIAAAQAGKHILCEKPLAIKVDDAARAVAECKKAGVSLGVNFHNRYLPWVNDTKGLIAEGTIGDVEVVQVEVSSGPRHYDNWRTEPDVAGLGSLYNVGVHLLDFLGVILDSLPVEVCAMFDHDPGSGKVERLALILLRFGNGTMAYANCNERIHSPQNNIAIFGSKGRIVGTRFTRSRNDGVLEVLTEERETVISYPAPRAHQLCLAAYTLAVLSGREPNPSGMDGLRSMQLCEAIATSVRERRVVEVDYGISSS